MHIGVRYDPDSVGVSSSRWTKALPVMLRVGGACILVLCMILIAWGLAAGGGARHFP
jgi:hypothetical protein